jgi:hypothetical protein
VFNGGGVAPVVIDEGGCVLQLEGDPGVRRRRSIEGKSSSEWHSPEGGGQRRRSDEVLCGGGVSVAENRRGGHLGDGNEGAALGRGWVRQTTHGGRKRSTGGSV